MAGYAGGETLVPGGGLASWVFQEMIAEEDSRTSTWWTDGSTASISRIVGRKDAGTLSSSRLGEGMMVQAGGVILSFASVGEVGAVGEVVAGLRMEQGPVSSGQRRTCRSGHWWSGGGGNSISHFSLNGERSGRGWSVEQRGGVSHLDLPGWWRECLWYAEGVLNAL